MNPSLEDIYILKDFEDMKRSKLMKMGMPKPYSWPKTFNFEPLT